MAPLLIRRLIAPSPLYSLSLILFLVYYPKELRYEHSISLSRQVRNQSGFSTSSSSPSHSSIDSEDQEDLDSLDSHIANNYSTFSPGESGIGSNLPPNAITSSAAGPSGAKGLAARLKKREREDQEAASSSAFSRLVPTFWPVWKAPQDQHGLEEDESGFTGVGGSSYVGTPNSNLHGAPSSVAPTPTGNGNAGESTSLLGPPLASGSAFAKSSANALLAPLLRAKYKRRTRSTKQRTPEWSLALAMAWVTGIHL